jgi:hypothetical protein
MTSAPLFTVKVTVPESTAPEVLLTAAESPTVCAPVLKDAVAPGTVVAVAAVTVKPAPVSSLLAWNFAESAGVNDAVTVCDPTAGVKV